MHRERLAAALAIGSILALGACAGPSAPSTSKPGTPPGSWGGAANLTSIPPVNDDPNQLLGMTSDRLGAALGLPTLVRRDGQAEIWQYRGEDCVLDLFLYGDVRTVEYVELRDRGDAMPDRVRDCFTGMLKPATAPGS